MPGFSGHHALRPGWGRIECRNTSGSRSDLSTRDACASRAASPSANPVGAWSKYTGGPRLEAQAENACVASHLRGDVRADAGNSGYGGRAHRRAQRHPERNPGQAQPSPRRLRAAGDDQRHRCARAAGPEADARVRPGRRAALAPVGVDQGSPQRSFPGRGAPAAHGPREGRRDPLRSRRRRGGPPTATASASPAQTVTVAAKLNLAGQSRQPGRRPLVPDPRQAAAGACPVASVRLEGLARRPLASAVKGAHRRSRWLRPALRQRRELGPAAACAVSRRPAEHARATGRRGDDRLSRDDRILVQRRRQHGVRLSRVLRRGQPDACRAARRSRSATAAAR